MKKYAILLVGSDWSATGYFCYQMGNTIEEAVSKAKREAYDLCYKKSLSMILESQCFPALILEIPNDVELRECTSEFFGYTKT